MAKTLFQRGADFVSSMVFMFASTNLVVELGIVLWVLMGWQFALAEFVGGAIMIVLFALLARVALRRRETEAARATLGGGGHEHGAGASRGSWRERLSSPAGWADAASYTFADAKMLRKEMAAGYLVAGFLAVLVPVSVWNDVFLTGHGFWTSLQNVIVGPFIAIISFVCSVGNVPLAAALWHGGISFGGVISFIFADLIALPLVLIYRKYYGTALALRLVAVFWAVMSVAGLIVEGIFRGSGLVPKTRRPSSAGTTRRSSTSSSSSSWPASGGSRGTNVASAAARATPSIPSAGCRWRWRTRERMRSTKDRCSTSARTTAATGSRPTRSATRSASPSRRRTPRRRPTASRSSG